MDEAVETDPAVEGQLTNSHPSGSALEVLGVSTRLGLTSFGGPVAHLGYFREEYVRRRGWMDEHTQQQAIRINQNMPFATVHFFFRRHTHGRRLLRWI